MELTALDRAVGTVPTLSPSVIGSTGTIAPGALIEIDAGLEAGSDLYEGYTIAIDIDGQLLAEAEDADRLTARLPADLQVGDTISLTATVFDWEGNEVDSAPLVLSIAEDDQPPTILGLIAASPVYEGRLPT